MMTFTVRHKYCGMEKRIMGYNVYDAYKSNGLDLEAWDVVSVER